MKKRQKFEVYELTNRQIMEIADILSKTETLDMPPKQIFDTYLEKFLPMCCDIKSDALIDMTPGEIRTVINAFVKKNDTLISIIYALKIDKYFSDMFESLKNIIPNILKITDGNTQQN